jgi:hypothetical protein
MNIYLFFNNIAYNKNNKDKLLINNKKLLII